MNSHVELGELLNKSKEYSEESEDLMVLTQMYTLEIHALPNRQIRVTSKLRN